MPGRKHPFITGNIYHVYNKTLEGKIINYFLRLYEICRYYRSANSILRFSKYIKLSPELKKYYAQKVLDKNNFRVSVLAYCFMPNHFHFLLKQNASKGISMFISQIQNSFTKYFNTINEKVGPLFLHRFKSKPVLNEEGLKHVFRYINLNPFSAGIINDENSLINYPWSSLKEYLFKKNDLCDNEYLLSIFNKNTDRLKEFILNNKEHQRMLKTCKYINKW